MYKWMPLEARAWRPDLPSAEDLERGPVWVHGDRLSGGDLDTCLARLMCVPLMEEHRLDATSDVHLPFYDATDHYELLIVSEPSAALREGLGMAVERIPAPISIVLTDRILITISDPESRAIPAAQQSFARARSVSLRAPLAVLLLEIVGHATDGFLALRDAISARLDEWERMILAHGQSNTFWVEIVDYQETFRRIESIAELQEEALTSWRDARADGELLDELSVRLADRIEHSRRLARFSERMSNRIDSLFQINLAVSAQRSSLVMQRLTVAAAVFLPLNLVAAAFGMNVGGIPGALSDHAFFWVLLAMATGALALIGWFRVRRWL